ncbi:MAG: Gfo/Idh/MocA family oxidoreductase [Actinobacteria bacterium]|nr:Gfo/Idh/MocA family oxidoreductase [Actinomycetota bacterium]
MPLNVGVVGLGSPVRRHAQTLQAIPEARVVAVADLDATRVAVHGGQYGARGYGDWSAMLAGKPALDAVILATPAHVRLAPIEAISARKIALFCVKPPALDLAAARAAARAFARSGIINSVGVQFRWSPTAGRLRDLIAARPRLFARLVVAWPVFEWAKNGRASPMLWREADCGGPLVEQGIHYQDVLRYVTGDEPLAVQAMTELGRTISDAARDCEDTTALLVRHASGMLSTHIHNWSHRGRVMELQVVGEDFELTWRMAQGEVLTGTVEGAAVEERHAADP